MRLTGGRYLGYRWSVPYRKWPVLWPPGRCRRLSGVWSCRWTGRWCRGRGQSCPSSLIGYPGVWSPGEDRKHISKCSLWHRILCSRRFHSHLDELLGNKQRLRGDLVKGVSHAGHHGRHEGGDVGVEGVSGMRDHDDVEAGESVDLQVGAARLVVEREDDTWSIKNKNHQSVQPKKKRVWHNQSNVIIKETWNKYKKKLLKVKKFLFWQESVDMICITVRRDDLLDCDTMSKITDCDY